MPEKSFIRNQLIRFSVNLSGDIINDAVIIGIPPCVNAPQECNFSIDRNKAIELAKEYGLEKGIKDWQASFMWSYFMFSKNDTENDTYVWVVSTILSDNLGTSEGKSVFIKASSGKFIKTSAWGLVAEYNQDNLITTTPSTNQKIQDNSLNTYLYIIAGIVVLLIIFFVVLLLKRKKK